LQADGASHRYGRITRAFLEFSASDWLSQTLLKHKLASVVQATWRGYRTRAWFRAAVADQYSRNRQA